ncbi:Uncharacterized protein dnm_096360 [Desulfonema magnum]|uniref:Uncharacterized protein n=1 Tax=Desulfonema magnum TaxID=45655 RepID=A0A975BZ17_9BACT|nr:Uncharacterized protein dnm_096360 [Desulfonema magnum]
MERSGTHLVRWVPLRSTHPTFFVSGMLYISSSLIIIFRFFAPDFFVIPFD